MQRYLLQSISVENVLYYAFESDKSKEQLNGELTQLLKTVERGTLSFQNFEFYKSTLEEYSVITLEDFWNDVVAFTNEFTTSLKYAK